MIIDKPVLVIIAGPTAVGKTAAALIIAKALKAEIISADARQLYKELQIGTSPPTEEELEQVTHHFIGNLSVLDTYNTGLFEKDVLNLLSKLFKRSRYAVMVGGSGLYIHAVCHGIDSLPEPDIRIREELNLLYKSDGIISLQEKLKILDPEYFQKVDLNNPSRLIRALEVSMITGKPYSTFRKQKSRNRNFRMIMIGLKLPRQELYARIDNRVDDMIRKGLVDEARKLLPFRSLNALNTVGYKELFEHFDGKLTLDEAIRLIKQHTRNYAKRQLTWFRRDKDITWFQPDDISGMLEMISLVTRNS